MLRKEMIRLQMLTLDMIDTVITDSSVSRTALDDDYTSDNVHSALFLRDDSRRNSLSDSDNLRSRSLSFSDKTLSKHFIDRDSVLSKSYDSGYTSENGHLPNGQNFLSGRSNGYGRNHFKSATSTQNGVHHVDRHSQTEQCNDNEVKPRVIGHDLTRIRISDRLKFRKTSAASTT